MNKEFDDFPKDGVLQGPNKTGINATLGTRQVLTEGGLVIADKEVPETVSFPGEYKKNRHSFRAPGQVVPGERVQYFWKPQLVFQKLVSLCKRGETPIRRETPFNLSG